MRKILFIFCIFLFEIHYTQTYYSQDFNTPGLNGWTSTDLDGDGYKWENNDISYAHPDFGSGSLVSYSSYAFTGDAGDPDNLITSPLINLSSVTANNVKLLFDVMAQNPFTSDKYSVYITTTDSPHTIIESTPIFTEVAAVGFQKRIIDLTSYIGQQIYISFRHYESIGQYSIIIDNIKVKTITDRDVALTKVNHDLYGIINTNYPIKATIKNNGNEVINNITLNWNDGANDHISTIDLSTPLEYGEETTITHPASIYYPSVVEKNITTTITQVNGAACPNLSDYSFTKTFNTVSQNSPKKVVLEEGTGTWCGACPSGAVTMTYMDTTYPNDFIGIAVHNDDIMTVSEYDTGANFNSFPTMNIDRAIFRQDVDPDNIVNHVNTRKNLITPAQLDASSALVGNSLTFNASATFRTTFSNSNYRFSAIVVEDEVHGTTSDYDQQNYYSSDSGIEEGPMGGYEDLPNPVPAAQMTYDHVGRMILGGYAGQPGSIPTTISDGQTVAYTFNATIPTTYDINKLKVVLLLINVTTGEVVNARSFMMNTLGTTEAQTNANYLTIYPNPTTDFIKVQANHNVDLTFYDMSGKLVLQKTNISPDKNVSVQGLTKGTYLVSIKEKGAETKTKKLIIK